MTKKEARKALLDIGWPLFDKWFCYNVSAGDKKIVQLYLDAGFSPDTVDETGVPALCLAARAGNLALCRLLVKAGADVNKRARDRGSSAIVDAALGKHAEIAAFLVKSKADVNIASKDGQSALIIAVGNADLPVIEILLKSHANIDVKDSLGASARTYAGLFKNGAVLDLFAKYGH